MQTMTEENNNAEEQEYETNPEPETEGVSEGESVTLQTLIVSGVVSIPNDMSRQDFSDKMHQFLNSDGVRFVSGQIEIRDMSI